MNHHSAALLICCLVWHTMQMQHHRFREITVQPCAWDRNTTSVTILHAFPIDL